MKLDEEKLKEAFDIEAELAKTPDADDMEFPPPGYVVKAPDLSTQEKVYDELGKLISKGSDILDTLQQSINDGAANGQMIVGTATMLNSVKDTLKEYTKIHMAHLNHIQAVEMEKLKQRHRLELASLRQKTSGGDINNLEGDKEVTSLVPFSQEAVINEIYKLEAGGK